MLRRWDGGPREVRRGEPRWPAWRKQEKLSAARTFGTDRPRPNKSDGTAFLDLFQREVKSTEHESLSLKAAWLEKLDREAAAVQRKPLLVACFGTMAPGVDPQWAILPLSDLSALIERLLEAQEQVKSLRERVDGGKDLPVQG